MAISAERFKYLDKETNVPTKDFTSLTDSLIYNTLDTTNSIPELDVSNNSKITLDALSGPKSELDAIAMDDSFDKKALVANALSEVRGMELPEMSRNALTKIEQINPTGLNGFLEDALKIGGKVLCNNSEFLKMFMAGYSPHKNVASGLLLGFLSMLLDMFCNEFTKNERNNLSKRDMLYNLAPYSGRDMSSNKALGNYKSGYSDYIKSKQPLSTPPATFNTPAFLDSITLASSNSEIRTIINSLEVYEFNSTERNSLITALDNESLVYTPGSQTYNNLLYAKGEVRNLPPIRSDRRARSITYEHTNDNLGSMMKNIGNLDLKGFQFNGLSGIDLSMFNSMSAFKTNSQSSNIAAIRSTRSGSFSDVDFSTVMPALSPQEETDLLACNIPSDSHREYDIHPTSDVFIDSWKI